MIIWDWVAWETKAQYLFTVCNKLVLFSWSIHSLSLANKYGIKSVPCILDFNNFFIFIWKSAPPELFSLLHVCPVLIFLRFCEHLDLNTHKLNGEFHHIFSLSFHVLIDDIISHPITRAATSLCA